MQRDCPVCDYPLRDGDEVVAVVVAKFKLLQSEVNYAIEHPSRCIELMHNECFDWTSYDVNEGDGD
jgi:hypothetical protein